jgi:hypothetical protein
MDLELHAHNMRLLFEAGYGNAACALAEQFGAGGIAERLLAALEQRSEVDTLRAQLAAANAQRDELLRLLKVERAEGGHADESPVVCRVFWGHECDCGWAKRRNTIDAAIARAQSGQPMPAERRDDDLSKNKDCASDCDCKG